MINFILKGILSLVIGLINIILTPIDLLINSALPSVSEALNHVNSFFSTLGGVVPWLVSYTGISHETLTIYVDLIVFIFTLPLMVHAIKLAIKWYNSLKV